ncbi:hypothetical protein GCM10007415_12300 [Parapedobacter pyrenivorans]|uniref:DUF5000 domain-containing protein n=1 Tax=Parapedobacter pyrenivorans TaxID=1305674 RepID=A0A917HJC5_9SPHI|nr:DUF4998 domain-containing protein [Parapedobacter pyrenivorans]GGG81240.1 hypothetical protein GCM10007415_12300 [Parapedobacter pyrenivorans]
MKTNQMRLHITGLSTVIIGLLAIVSCKKMDDQYRAFIEGGETIYVGKTDSLAVHGGNGRVEVSWLLISDPKVTGYRLFWNNGKDSLQGDLSKTSTIDTVRVTITDLAEGIHHFDVFLFDRYGNSSVKSSISGKSYGERYQRSLLNRAYRTIRRIGNDLEIGWMPADNTMADVELHYVAENGENVVHQVAPYRVLDTLSNFPRAGKFTYRTAFLPEAAALDTFYSEQEVFQEVLEEALLDKAVWSLNALPSDTYLPEFNDWKIENLWDNQISSPNFFYMNPNLPELSLPNWFTLDLGYASRLTKITVNQLSHDPYWMFNVGAPKQFEIYGSNDPASDGSWDSWTLLGTFESVKPSGLPVGEVSEQDAAIAVAGETFNFPATDKFYQYIRFKTNATWGGNLNVMIAELTFWGYQ